MASIGIIRTSPSESGVSADVDIADIGPNLWTQEVLESFGHDRAPPPTYKIPRKEVNSTLIFTPTDVRARQLSIVPSVSNEARSSVSWRNPHITPPEENANEDEPSPVYSQYPSSPISPREEMERNLETSCHLSGLGRNSGSKRSDGSSVQVAVGDYSRSGSISAARQVFIRKESQVNRGVRGTGPQFRMADSLMPESHRTTEAGGPMNISTTPIPRTSNNPLSERLPLTSKLPPNLQNIDYGPHSPSFFPIADPVGPFSNPSNGEVDGGLPRVHTRSRTIRGLEIPEHSMHSPYIHHSPIRSNHGDSNHATCVGVAGAEGATKGNGRNWEDDPENPLNWNMRKKCYNTLLAVLYTFAVLFAATDYLPACGALAVRFAVSPTATVVGFMLFMFGLACGPLLGLTLSNLYGRRPVYGLALPISCMFTMGGGLATNLGAVLVCRFFAAVVASPAVAIGFFMIGDLWSAEKTKLPMMVYMVTVCGGVSLGPVIGGFAVSYGNWAWSMWLTLIVSGVIYMLSYFMSETHKITILHIRERDHNQLESPVPPPPTPGHGGSADMGRSASRRLRRARASSIRREHRLSAIKNGFQVAVIRAGKMLIFEPIVIVASVCMGFVFGCLTQLLISVPLVFAKVYHVDLVGSDFTILGISGGVVICVIVSIILELTVYKRAQERMMSGLGGRVAPEEKLQLLLCGSVLFPVSLFWWAWSAQERIHWFLPILAGIAIGFAGFSIILGITLYVQEVYPGDTFISVISANTTVQFVFGAIFPLFTISMYNKMSVGWAGSTMAFISLIFVPLPWILWKRGRDWRQRSEYGVNIFCEKERREVSAVV